MKNNRLMIAGAIIVVMAFIFFKNKNEDEKVQFVEDEERAEVAPVKPTQNISVEVKSELQSQDLTAAEAVKTEPQESDLREIQLRSRFAGHMRNLSRCLGLSAASSSESAPLDPDTVISALRPSLGDTVLQMNDWSQTEFVDRDSTRKRVRVDFDYIDNSNYSRRLSMYQINEYGMPEIVELTPDQSNNPNQGYIDSLSEGMPVTSRESAARVYFNHGEEFVFSVRNGRLQNISVTRGERAFNCYNLDQESSNCSCP